MGRILGQNFINRKFREKIAFPSIEKKYLGFFPPMGLFFNIGKEQILHCSKKKLKFQTMPRYRGLFLKKGNI